MADKNPESNKKIKTIKPTYREGTQKKEEPKKKKPETRKG